MNVINFNLEKAIPHPSFNGVLLFPILNENELLGIRSNFALILPGCEISPHTHDVVEVFTILSGSPEVLIDHEWIPIAAGTTVVAPPGELHGVRNATSDNVMLQANFNCK